MANETTSLSAIRKPWDYNPSKWQQRVRISIIAGVAMLIAVYMGLYQWRLIDSVWDPVFGEQSQQVLDSNVSDAIRSWVLIPDATLGALAYLGDIVFALAGSTRRWQYRPWLVVLFSLDVIPLGIVSAILVVLQGAVVGSWCFLCLVTAVLSLSLVCFAYDEVWSTLKYLYGIWKETRRSHCVWDAFCGRPSAEAHAVGQRMIQD